MMGQAGFLTFAETLGSLRPRHGYHTLPDGTLTPLHVVMALTVARDGTVYATTIYPFTLLRIPAVP